LECNIVVQQNASGSLKIATVAGLCAQEISLKVDDVSHVLQKDSTVELVQGVTHKSDGPATLH